MSDGETSILTRSSYRETVGTVHCALENGSNLHVNVRQKTRHYRARSIEEEKELEERLPNLYFLLRAART